MRLLLLLTLFITSLSSSFSQNVPDGADTLPNNSFAMERYWDYAYMHGLEAHKLLKDHPLYVKLPENADPLHLVKFERIMKVFPFEYIYEQKIPVNGTVLHIRHDSYWNHTGLSGRTKEHIGFYYTLTHYKHGVADTLFKDKDRWGLGRVVREIRAIENGIYRMNIQVDPFTGLPYSHRNFSVHGHYHLNGKLAIKGGMEYMHGLSPNVRYDSLPELITKNRVYHGGVRYYLTRQSADHC